MRPSLPVHGQLGVGETVHCGWKPVTRRRGGALLSSALAPGRGEAHASPAEDLEWNLVVSAWALGLVPGLGRVSWSVFLQSS